MSSDDSVAFDAPEREYRVRGYCENCGTMALHDRHCATCGFSFAATTDAPSPAGNLALDLDPSPFR